MAEITRQELQESVWNAPLKHLAEKWAVDVRKLTALCSQLDIVRPKAGYWTQKTMGKNQALPELDCHNYAEDYTVDLATIKLLNDNSPTVPNITVPKRLHKLELEIVRAKSSYTVPSYRYDYIMTAPYRETDEIPAISVSEAQFQRALRILDTLYKYFKKQGWKIGIQRHRRTCMNTVTIDGQVIRFRIREELKQHKRELTSEEKADQLAGRSVWHERINIPSGILSISLDHWVEGKKIWCDTKAFQLEECLSEVVAGMTRVSVLEKEAATRRAEQEALRQREQKLKNMVKTLRLDWEDRISVFLGQYERWSRAEQCRKFIAQAHSTMPNNGPLTLAQMNWLNWAKDIAAQLDPISEIAEDQLTAWDQWGPFSSQLNNDAKEKHQLLGINDTRKDELSLAEIEAGLRQMNLIP